MSDSRLNTLDSKTYIQHMMKNDINTFSASSKIKTGYSNIDRYTYMYPGTYVLGAISSLGKTTFILQMCDQMASAGHHILYFTFEQDRLDLVSKSLARTMANKNAKEALTALDIRNGETCSLLDDVIKDYDEFCENISIVECAFDTTMNQIEECIDTYIEDKKRKPIVVIDYLQAISGNGKNGAKDIVDENVRRLKNLQRKHKIILIVISSFNRQNYMSQVDFESFKESGGIEYTADAVWGLQLEVLNNGLFDMSGQINAKRKMLREAKCKMPRGIEFVCLKNRNGLPVFTCNFNYYPQYDLFKSVN